MHFISFLWAEILPREEKDEFDGLAQDCSNSSALAMELLQSCAKPSNLSHLVNTRAVDDDLGMQGARASVALVVTELS